MEMHPGTKAVRAGMGTDSVNKSVIPPIYVSTNYVFDSPTSPGRYEYSRVSNPTRDMLGEALAEMEGGAGCVVTSSGLAAVTLVLEGLLPPHGLVIAQHDLYGGTWRLMDHLAAKERLRVLFVDFSDAAALSAALDQQPALVWMETPSNPLLRLTDIKTVAHLAHSVGAKVLVDNTILSPLLQQPIQQGADLVLHSTTKFINGHSDVVGGAVISADEELHETVFHWAKVLGLTGGAIDAYLTLRGLRTLDARLKIHDENTTALLSAIMDHPALAKVHHPSLPTHPGHALAAHQQRGFGSLVSLDLAGGREAVDRFLAGLEIFHLAESLGGVESLVCHPPTMTHAGMAPEARYRAGITDGMVRLSVGVEHRQDIVADIEAALDRAA